MPLRISHLLSEYSSRNLIPNQTLRDRQRVVHRRRFIVSSMRLRRRISFKLFSESSHVVHTHFLASPPRTIYLYRYTHTRTHTHIYIAFEIVTRTNACIRRRVVLMCKLLAYILYTFYKTFFTHP
jgi:hypothetical protein